MKGSVLCIPRQSAWLTVLPTGVAAMLIGGRPLGLCLIAGTSTVLYLMAPDPTQPEQEKKVTSDTSGSANWSHAIVAVMLLLTWTWPSILAVHADADGTVTTVAALSLAALALDHLEARHSLWPHLLLYVLTAFVVMSATVPSASVTPLAEAEASSSVNLRLVLAAWILFWWSRLVRTPPTWPKSVATTIWSENMAFWLATFILAPLYAILYRQHTDFETTLVQPGLLHAALAALAIHDVSSDHPTNAQSQMQQSTSSLLPQCAQFDEGTCASASTPTQRHKGVVRAATIVSILTVLFFAASTVLIWIHQIFASAVTVSDDWDARVFVTEDRLATLCVSLALTTAHLFLADGPARSPRSCATIVLAHTTGTAAIRAVLSEDSGFSPRVFVLVSGLSAIVALIGTRISVRIRHIRFVVRTERAPVAGRG